MPTKTTLLKVSRTRLLIDKLINRVSKTLVVRPYQGKYSFFCLPHDTIGRQIAFIGGFERDEISALAEIAQQHISRSDPASRNVLLDIGANIGTHSINLSGFFDRIIAVEPNPIVANVLRANIELNRLSNATVVQVAFSDQAGVAALRFPERDNLGMATLQDAANRSSVESTDVTLVIGDECLPRHVGPDERVAMIKVDVEGHEVSALSGLKGTISSHRPLIAFEISQKESGEATIALLRQLGYEQFLWLTRRRSSRPRGRLATALEFLLRGGSLYVQKLEAVEYPFYPMVIAVHASARWPSRCADG